MRDETISFLPIIPKRECRNCRHSLDTNLLKKPRGKWRYCPELNKWILPDFVCACWVLLKKEVPPVIKKEEKPDLYEEELPF